MYTLLVIDDEPFVRRGIVSLVPFGELGVGEILEASNGLEGLALVNEKEPDMILCDINMPKMNGLDFAKKVKEEKPWIKIALITGYDYFDYAKQGIKLGVEDYVLKPVSRQDVYEVVALLIKKIEKDKTIKEVYKSLRETTKHNSLNEKLDDSTGYKALIDDIMKEHIMKEDFSLSFLAEELCLNDTYVSSLFKKIYAIPFQDYVLNLRLERGKLLILTTSLKNYEIAEAIGIVDPNYFSTLFRKKFGYSPNKFKKKIQNNEVQNNKVQNNEME